MEELIDEQVFIGALNIAAIITIAIGAICLLAGWRLRHFGLRLSGITLAAAGVAIWLLWQVYFAVTEHFGLDSVKGLGVNILVFVVIGVVIGIFIRIMRNRMSREGS